MLYFQLPAGFCLPSSRLIGLCSLLLAAAGNFTTRAEEATKPKQGAELLKTDILCVFAHPDDETGAASTLALYARGGKVVANVYCTRGEGGGNMVGTQGGDALGILRETELRDCLQELGVRYCYFLDRRDWAYTESLAATLEKWNKEQTLERLVRLVRTLRPEVMLTMNPAPSPGQHGHHQAAGVLATEAFAAAADPSRFPAQLHDEGLSVWQPRKLYFTGKSGSVTCAIQVDQPMADGMTPAQFASRALSNHRSQAFGNFGDSPWLKRPQSFSLIKSFVAPEAHETDLLHGLPLTGSELKEVEVAPAPARQPIELSFVGRPAINRYRLWVKQQHIEHAAMQFRTDVPLVAGNPNEVQLVIDNNSGQVLKDDLKLEVPEGWSLDQRSQKLQVDAGKTATRRFTITPAGAARGDVTLKASVSTDGCVAEATGHVVPYATVIHLDRAPSLDGTDREWQKVPAMEITPRDLVEGKVASEADSSASFRIAHDGQKMYLDIKVNDDVVVTNIAPNDIKGHWRSDSVEICVDPVGGAEHTFGCFKLGIFPFDTTGVVRAARDADAKQGLVEETAPGTRLVSWRTADGYRIQASIPFSELGLDYPHRRLFGFNLIIYDGDKANAALGENVNKSRIAWSPRPGVQGRPEDWGRLQLQ